jgi:HAE1 family hydrophobic/amphiphilic exporter-1
VVQPDVMRTHGVGMEDVRAALDASNYSSPGGMIRRGRFRYSLRTRGQFASVGEIRQVSVRPGDGGETVPLGELARVLDTFAEQETVARYNGRAAVGIQVYKESGSNTVRVAEAVEATLDRLREEYPAVDLTVATNQARFVRSAISNVVQALLLGGLLAFAVLFLFLREPRYPVAIGLAIPLSVVAAFTLCYAFDVSLNVMSLGGLALGVGMLVDNSIVVLENVFRHRDEVGSPPLEAASRGAGEVAAAITASTLTTIAVFGPVLYVEGVAGALFGDLSLAVAFSLLASLLVALTLLPVLAARMGGAAGNGAEPAPTAPSGGRAGSATGPSGEAGGVDGEEGLVAGAIRRARGLFRLAREGVAWVGAALRDTARDVRSGTARVVRRATGPAFGAFDRAFRAFARRYERTLEWSLEHRGSVLALAAGALGTALLLGSALPRSLMPQVDEGRFRVELELPVGTPLATTAETARRLEEMLLEAEGVEGVFARVGRARGTGAAARELTGLNQATLEVRLASDGPRAQEAIASFRRRVEESGVDAGLVSAETGRATSLGQALGVGDADLAVKVKGQRIDRLVAVAESARARIAGLQEVADARVDFQRSQPEVVVDIDRDAVARHGLRVREVADAIEAFLRGTRTETPYTEFADKISIRVELPDSARRRLPDVLDLTVSGVPLQELVSVRRGYGPVEIRREDQSRTVEVLADVTGGLGRAVEQVKAELAGLSLPSLTTVEVGGRNEQMRRSFRSLLFAFGLAFFLVYLILAAQFESVVQPLVVLMAVPLAAVGAVVALWFAGDGLNVMSGIGVVILVGIVVNDAIIKVDFINQRREQGMPGRAAILEAGRLRLRPIVMTTVTTVLGLLPMALGWGAGADLRAPLAVAVIGGLLSATFLTLIVVPVIYSALVAGVGREDGAARADAAADPPTAGGGAAGRGVPTT